MARKRRNFGTKGFNHCIIRGIDKKDIFFDLQDRYKFLKVVKQNKEKYNIKIGTYVLMPNHVHFIIQGESQKISDFFHSVLVSYSAYYNLKYERVGHLFQNRYLNKPIEDERYFKHLVKYIHYNPEKAGIGTVTKYLWSGYNEFFKKKTWIDTDIILALYGDNIIEAREKFVKEHTSKLDKYYENFVEYEIVNRLTDEQVKNFIEEKTKKYRNSNCRDLIDTYYNKVIKEALDLKGVSVNQVNRITGINRRLLKKIKG